MRNNEIDDSKNRISKEREIFLIKWKIQLLQNSEYREITLCKNKLIRKIRRNNKNI